MLTLEQYGVKLTRVREQDIELIRYWRNQPEISEYMLHRGYISEEAQKAWFRSINNKFNYYFIIEYKGRQVGLINSKNYDPGSGYGEGGIFIWDKELQDSFVPVFASLCLLNFMMGTLNVSSISRARILKSNERAIHYNKLLGYKLMPGQENEEHQLYELKLEDFKICAVKLNKAAELLNPGNAELKYSGEPGEENMDAINALLA
jgi:UDP-4-amino-4,6-dideoxy-N-acetyl-beta-L-altrosamine N-acetyltransferase